MSGAAVLARAEAEGIVLRLDGGLVQMQATRAPPSDLLAELRANRDEVAHLLALRLSPQPPEPEPEPPPDADEAANPPSDEQEEAEDWSAVDAWIMRGSGPHSASASATDCPIATDPLAGLQRAALARPARWMDLRAVPNPGTYCAACDGRRWGWDGFLWRCLACHPDASGTRDTKEIAT